MGRNAITERQICQSKAQGRRNEEAKGLKCQALPDVKVFNGILKIDSQEALVGLEESGCKF